MILKQEKEKWQKIKPKLLSYEENLHYQIKRAKREFGADYEITMVTLVDMYDKILATYERHKTKPYFAKIDFEDEKTKHTSSAYVGRIGFVDIDPNHLIIDWRSSFASLYYNSKLGHSTYTNNGEEICGNLLQKMQINFEDGNISSCVLLDENLSADEMLLPYLQKDASGRLSDIVATIQEEQNAIIRLKENSNICVQGVAGSGKTTVALHRLSYLMYNFKEKIKSNRYLIVSPNMAFKSYITSLLEDLDAEDSLSFSVDNIVRIALGYDFTFLSKDQTMSQNKKTKNVAEIVMFKCGKEFEKCLNLFFEDFEKELFYKPLIIENVEVVPADVMFDLYEKTRQKTIEESLQYFKNKVSFYAGYTKDVRENLKQKLLNKEISFIQKMNIERMLDKGVAKHIKVGSSLNIFSIYKNFITNLNNYTNFEFVDALKQTTLKNINKKTFGQDDIGALMVIASRLKTFDLLFNVLHTFIDEGQDLCYMQYLGISKLLPKSTFNIYGDIAQVLCVPLSLQSWQEILPLFNNMQILQLNKSYRTTIEISKEANKTLEKLNLSLQENVLRHGEDIEEINAKDRTQAFNDICQTFNNSKHKTMAIIFKDLTHLAQNKDFLKDVTIVESDSDLIDFENNQIFAIDCTTSKGLEFDFVCVVEPNTYNNDELKKLYVAKTRALHVLKLLNF